MISLPFTEAQQKPEVIRQQRVQAALHLVSFSAPLPAPVCQKFQQPGTDGEHGKGCPAIVIINGIRMSYLDHSGSLALRVPFLRAMAGVSLTGRHPSCLARKR
jgi:hypothetical protein